MSVPYKVTRGCFLDWLDFSGNVIKFLENDAGCLEEFERHGLRVIACEGRSLQSDIDNHSRAFQAWLKGCVYPAAFYRKTESCRLYNCIFLGTASTAELNTFTNGNPKASFKASDVNTMR